MVVKYNKHQDDRYGDIWSEVKEVGPGEDFLIPEFYDRWSELFEGYEGILEDKEVKFLYVHVSEAGGLTEEVFQGRRNWLPALKVPMTDDRFMLIGPLHQDIVANGFNIFMRVDWVKDSGQALRILLDMFEFETLQEEEIESYNYEFKQNP